MSDILCVTNRGLCSGDFLAHVEKLAAAGPAGIVLREKDLTVTEYKALAGEVLKICRKYDTPCILHSFADAARELNCPAIHLPLPALRALTAAEKGAFAVLGASCHSAEEAREAEKLGCTYITAGHVFDTGCKKGLPGRGLAFLSAVCRAVSIPVYAIGGICPENMAPVRTAGAKGACVMSGAMKCQEPGEYLAALERGASI